MNVFEEIDAKAKYTAEKYCKEREITHEIAGVIIDLYKSEAELKKVFEDGSFLMAYHEPISSKLEFFLARLFYHISLKKNLNRKVYLRKQKNKCAPDIRVENGDGKTVFIVEVKANAGWMQCFISPEAYKKDDEKGRHPEELIESHKKQLTKYNDTFGTSDVYMFLPTLKSVHRKNYKTDYEGYKNNFEKNTGLPEDKFVILSSDLHLDLAWENVKKGDIDKEKLTRDFEKMLDRFTG